MNRQPEISIVVPAFNEERRLPRCLEKLTTFIDSRHLNAEVIVVDDGSTDRTAHVVYEFRDRLPLLFLLTTGDRNHGKGFAVKTGMLAARGRVALFTDADLSAPIEECEKLLAALEDADVAIGSRAVDRRMIQARQSRARELAGILFNFAVRLFTGVPFVDTQCGFKAFHMDRCQIIFQQQRIEGFGFDPELLYLAKRHGLRSVEIPVHWAHDPDTKVRVLADGLKMVVDLLIIRFNALLGRYPKPAPRAADAD